MIGIYYLFGGDLKTVSGIFLAVAYMFTPAISVLIVEKLIYKESIPESTGVSFRLNSWFLIAWLLPPIISLGTFAVSLLFPNVSFSPDIKLAIFYKQLNI